MNSVVDYFEGVKATTIKVTAAMLEEIESAEVVPSESRRKRRKNPRNLG
jgi:hypothetical protein